MNAYKVCIIKYHKSLLPDILLLDHFQHGHDKFSQVRDEKMNWPKLRTEENMSLESFPSLTTAERVTPVKGKT